MDDTVAIISVLERRAIPTTREVVRNLQERVENAKSNRTNCLIAKTTGVSVSGVGSIFTVVGFALAPFTMGISAAVCSGIGIAMTVGGVATTVGTTITDHVLQTGDFNELKKLVETFQKIQNMWKEIFESNPGLEQKLTGVSSNNAMHCSPEHARSKNDYLYLLQWLKIGNLYSDKEIDSQKIKKGDHIFRPSEKCFGVRVLHHGVYLGDNKVVDFGDKAKNKQPLIRRLRDYLNGSKTVYRRNYHKYQIPIEDTIKLARKIVQEKNWEKYHLFQNNCEHFATFLKLNCKWSEQVESASIIGNGVLTGVKIAHKPVQLALDSFEVAANALSKSHGFWSGIFKGAAPGAMSGLSKALVVVGPLMTAVDIGFLVSDWLVDQPNIENLQKALNMVENQLQSYELFLARANEVYQIEWQIMEANEKRIIAWRDTTVKLIAQGDFVKNNHWSFRLGIKIALFSHWCSKYFVIGMFKLKGRTQRKCARNTRISQNPDKDLKPSHTYMSIFQIFFLCLYISVSTRTVVLPPFPKICYTLSVLIIVTLLISAVILINLN